MVATTYPTDSQFKDGRIDGVEGDGPWTITCDGWCFGVPANSPVVPRVGSTARFYGKGIGHTVRGLFIDGVKVFYRTEAEDAEHFEIELYGRDAEDLLARWDAGRTVFTIEMGGLGPGYEQCIHIICFEVLRYLLATKPDASKWSDRNVWEKLRKKIEDAVLEKSPVKELGVSGAQWGAGVSLATVYYKRGPRDALNDPMVEDRRIQVSNNMRFVAR